MNLPTEQMPVGRLVAEHPEYAPILERLEIDYCCGGDRSLAAACRERDLDPDTVARMLDAAVQSAHEAQAADDWTSADVKDLIEHIERRHHAYLRENLPRLEMLIGRVVDHHGDDFSWARPVQDVFTRLKSELEAHMEKEEQRVFPAIVGLAEGEHREDVSVTSDDDQIPLMEQEHDQAGAALTQLRELTEGYRVPEGACPTLRQTMRGLEELEENIHQHVHKENNILFEKARELVQAEA